MYWGDLGRKSNKLKNKKTTKKRNDEKEMQRSYIQLAKDHIASK